MTTATQLVSTPPAATPYDIVRAAYAELHVTDLEASERFYVELLGMIVSERTQDAVYLRGWEERLHHSLVIRRAPLAAAARLAFWVRAEAHLDLLAADVRDNGLDTASATADDPVMAGALSEWAPFSYP